MVQKVTIAKRYFSFLKYAMRRAWVMLLSKLFKLSAQYWLSISLYLSHSLSQFLLLHS